MPRKRQKARRREESALAVDAAQAGIEEQRLAALRRKLSLSPDVRGLELNRARALVADPAYPRPAVLRATASLLADRLLTSDRNK